MEKDLEYFKKLGKNLMFDLTDEEAENIQKEFDVLLQQLSLLEDIDTSDVEEMIYPFEQDTTFLREDVINQTVNQEEALSNVSNSKQGHFVVPRVVK